MVTGVLGSGLVGRTGCGGDHERGPSQHTAERREWQWDTLKGLWVVSSASSAWWVGDGAGEQGGRGWPKLDHGGPLCGVWTAGMS